MMKKILAVLTVVLFLNVMPIMAISANALTSVDGYSVEITTGKPSIIVIGRKKCGRCHNTMQRIIDDNIPDDYNVYFIGCDCDNENSVIDMAADFPANITYCFYDYSFIHDYYKLIPPEDVDSDGTFSLPVIGYLDSYGNIIKVTSGSKKSDEIRAVFGDVSLPSNQTTQCNDGSCAVSFGDDETEEDVEEDIDEVLDEDIEYEQFYFGETISLDECYLINQPKQVYNYPDSPGSDYDKKLQIIDPNGRTLIRDIDYALEYRYFEGYLGKYWYRITGINSYHGTIEGDFVVVPEKAAIRRIEKKSTGAYEIYIKPSEHAYGYRFTFTTSSGRIYKYTVKASKIKNNKITVKINSLKSVSINAYMMTNGERLYAGESYGYKVK